MPFGHGRTTINHGKFAEREACLQSKRYIDQKTRNFFSKDHQGAPALLRDSEQRCMIFTFVTLELDSWKILAPYSLLVRSSDLKTLLDSEARVKEDASVSGMVISSDTAGASELSSENNLSSCSSSVANVSERTHNRNKRTKPLKNSYSTSPPSSLRSDSDGSNVADTDVLVNSISKVDKYVKRISRKKRKKKGKQYKKSMPEKVSPLLETECEESISDASVSGTVINSDTAGASELSSENNLSKNLTSCSLPAPYIKMELDESQINNSDDINCSERHLLCKSYRNEIHQPTACFSKRSAGEEVSCNQLDICGGSNHIATKSSSTQSPVIQSACDQNTINDHPIDGIHCDISCSISFDKDNAPVAGAYIDKWKLEINQNCSNDVETCSSIKDDKASKCGIILDKNTSFHSITETSHDRDTETFSSRIWSKDVIDTVYNTERTEYSSQACSSDDFQPVINRKRSRLSKRASQNLNAIPRFGTDMHDLTGKYNNYSRWQKVQKNATEDYICEPKKVVSPRVEISSKRSERKEMFDRFVGSNQNRSGNLSTYTYAESVVQIGKTDMVRASADCDSSEMLSQGIDRVYNVHEKLRRKQDSDTKHGNRNSTKVSHTDTTNMDRPSEDHVQQKELRISPQLTRQQCTSIGNRFSISDFRNDVVMRTENVDFCQSGPHHKSQITMEEDASSGGTHSTACDTSSDVTEDSVSPSMMTSNSLHHIKDHCDSSNDMHGEDHRYMVSESESSHVDSSKLENAPIPVFQKWLPVEKKDSMALDMGQTSSLTAVVNESVLSCSNSKNEEVELLSSNSHQSLQISGRVPYLNPCLEDTVCLSLVENVCTIYHPRAYVEYGGILAASNRCLMHKVKSQCFETDLDKIVQAVDDSYRLQTASEGVRLVTGSPVAEFEKFVLSASPTLDQITCRTSSTDQLIGDCFCGPQIPNIPLECLWQWYEKPGSYGIEVKAEDNHNTKRFHDGRFEFRAYFVPYLSAIQLFGRSRSSTCTNNCYPCEGVIEGCEADEICNQSVRRTNLDDGELLFEYFESDPPQQRRPLFEKLKELIRGGTSSDSKLFGDPMKLKCLNLHDLHPASWYSVAWYPIYRIPDGSFHATFLTYHSLGSFVCTMPKGPSGVAHIVSPVVGLQSYNAMGECWFRPRGLKSKAGEEEAALSSDPSEILKERLRMLEQTASVMARASVRKGNLRSTNRQPDYEFFLSRR